MFFFHTVPEKKAICTMPGRLGKTLDIDEKTLPFETHNDFH